MLGFLPLAAAPLADAVPGDRLDAARGTFTLTGQNVTLAYGHKMNVGAGSGAPTFILSGKAVTLAHGHKIGVAAASFILAGQDVGFLRSYVAMVGAGSFTETGQDVALRATRYFYPAAASFALTGKDVAFVVGLDNENGLYIHLRGEQITSISLDGNYRAQGRLGGRGVYAN
jgi:hypothetical protein